MVLLNKVHHTFHKLGTTTMVLRSIVQIDHQGRDVGKALTYRLPPLCETIGQAVAGDFSDAAVEKHFIESGQQESNWRQSRLGLEIVISSFCLGSTFAATRKRANFDRSFGID